MNKIILTLRTLSIVMTFCYPQFSQATTSHQKMVFKGFHLAANLGYGVGYSRERFTTAAGGATVSASDKSGLDGIDGGINLGYTYVFSAVPIALGGEGLANWSKVKGNRKFSAAVGGATANFTASARLKQSLQLVARMGYALAGAMPFIKFGWDNSAWEFNSKVNVTPGLVVINAKKSKRINGIAYGGGIDVPLTKRILAGVEYTRVDFKKQTVTFGGRNTKASYEPHNNKFAAVVKILFH